MSSLRRVAYSPFPGTTAGAVAVAGGGGGGQQACVSVCSVGVVCWVFCYPVPNNV